MPKTGMPTTPRASTTPGVIETVDDNGVETIGLRLQCGLYNPLFQQQVVVGVAIIGQSLWIDGRTARNAPYLNLGAFLQYSAVHALVMLGHSVVVFRRNRRDRDDAEFFHKTCSFSQ
jgi:hypothetical protein